MKASDKIYVAGHSGLIGSAIVRKLQDDGFTNIITRDHTELDLTVQPQVAKFFEQERPKYVFFSAGKVGGVYANITYRAEFIYENLMMASNVIHHAYQSEVEKLIYIGCSSAYPKHTEQPMKESSLLTGSLEPTNEPFAISKLAGMKLCESYHRQYGVDFISVIPANVYGGNQNYELLNSLVIPALIRKLHEAKEQQLPEVLLWGSGRPCRDFIYVDDVADATVFLAQNYAENDVFNIGTGRDYTISDLANLIKDIVGYNGKIIFDRERGLEGVDKKLQDVSKLDSMGWKYSMSLEEGLKITYADYLKNPPRD